MSSLIITNNIYKQAARRNIASLARQQDRKTRDARLFLSAWIFGPLFLIHVQLIDHGQDHDDAKVEMDDPLRNLGTTWDSSGVNQPWACGLLMGLFANSILAIHLCASEVGPATIEPYVQASPQSHVSNPARQTQVHESDNAIHRFMPPNGVLYFNVDRDSFRRNRVPDEVTAFVISAAKMVASIMERQNLGISFSYRPSSNRNVFDIRCDPSLAANTMAKSFFPSDSRNMWKLGITTRPRVLYSGLPFMANILAHEFAHILGLRHWEAGIREHEASFQWPDTECMSRVSVMNTGVPYHELWFSDEDYRVIRELYSLVNGDVFAGRRVIDVHP